MSRDCNIVRDLLPLYAEKMLSADSVAFVEEHLKECQACRKELESLQQGDSALLSMQDHADEAIPIRKVKKKLSKKKAAAIAAAVVLTLAAAAVIMWFRPAAIDYGNSEIYSQPDIISAVECVKADFKSYQGQGCKLYSLSYAGDEQIRREKELQLRQEGRYDEYIVILAAFRSPIFGGGAWNASFVYHWNWILGRNAGGEWAVIGKGVG